MFPEAFFADTDQGTVFSQEQASRFAKEIAGDFNPLHDVGAARFCVPGDLLFSVALAKYGLSQSMKFSFSGMVTDKTPLLFPQTGANEIVIRDHQGKEYLDIERNGALSSEAELLTGFTLSYIRFSGHTFLDILLPLMERHQVIINPARPMVIYEYMSFKLESLDIEAPALEFTGSELQVQGKRGNVVLKFALLSDGETVGRGKKKMVLAGLREYTQAAGQHLKDYYRELKTGYAG